MLDVPAFMLSSTEPRRFADITERRDGAMGLRRL
jgi:hypothetical protein